MQTQTGIRSERELTELRFAKLRRQLDYLMDHSAFYRAKLNGTGLQRGKLKGLADLARLPFTTKEELRESQSAQPPLGLHAAVTLRDVVRIHSSTGTTGQPSWVGLTKNDICVWTDITGAALTTQGLTSDDVVIHAASLALFVGGLPVKDAAESIGATFVPVGTGASEKALMAIQTLGANCLHCTPSYAVYLAEYVRSRFEVQPVELGIRKILCGGEPGGGEPAFRQRITSEWEALVTEGMGNADMAPIIWAECPAQAGMHFTAGDHVIAELIDPDNGHSVEWEDGATGEVVYTATDRECCPLLRFRTRDRVVVLGMECECGRTGPRIRCVGRTDDMLIVLGVNVFPSAVRDVVAMLVPRSTGAVQILLSEPGPRLAPPLKLVVEYGPGATDLEALRRELEALIRGRLSVAAQVELVPPDTLPRFEMKTQLIRRLYEGK